MDPQMIWVIGTIVSVLAFVMNYWTRKTGRTIKKPLMVILLYSIAFLLVLSFGPFVLPDPVTWPTFPSEPGAFMVALLASAGVLLSYLGSWITLLTTIVGAAMAPYALLTKKFFERIKPLPEVMKG